MSGSGRVRACICGFGPSSGLTIGPVSNSTINYKQTTIVWLVGIDMGFQPIKNLGIALCHGAACSLHKITTAT